VVGGRRVEEEDASVQSEEGVGEEGRQARQQVALKDRRMQGSMSESAGGNSTCQIAAIRLESVRKVSCVYRRGEKFVLLIYENL